MLAVLSLGLVLGHRALADSPLVVATVDGLAGASTATGAASVLGRFLPGDGGGGTFSYVPASTRASDGGCVVQAAGGGAWIRNLDAVPARPEFFCGAIANNSEIDATPCFRAALDCAGWVVAGRGEYTFRSTLEIGTGERLEGVGPDATNLTLAPGANTDLVRSRGFAALHLQDKWFADEGVPTGMQIRNLALNGNAPSQGPRLNAAGSGIRLYAKRFVVENVLAFDFPGSCFASECGQRVGQRQTSDMPEAEIGPLWVRNCGSGNFVFAGPHDAFVKRLFSAGGDGDGVSFLAQANVYEGEADIGFIHVYGARGTGIFSNATVQAQYVITESNAGGGWLMAGAGTQVSLLKAFNNADPGQGPAPAPSGAGQALPQSGVIDVQGKWATVGQLRLSQSSPGTALRLRGTGSSVGNALVECSGEGVTGVRVEANQVTVSGRVQGASGGDGAVVLGPDAATGQGVSMARVSVDVGTPGPCAVNYTVAGADNTVAASVYSEAASPRQAALAGAAPGATDSFAIVSRSPKPGNGTWQEPAAGTRWRGIGGNLSISQTGTVSATLPHGLLGAPEPGQCGVRLSTVPCMADGAVVAGPWITAADADGIKVSIAVQQPCPSPAWCDVVIDCDASSALWSVRALARSSV